MNKRDLSERNEQIINEVTARFRAMATDPDILGGGCAGDLEDVFADAARKLAGRDGDLHVANQDAAFLCGVAIGRLMGGAR